MAHRMLLVAVALALLGLAGCAPEDTADETPVEDLLPRATTTTATVPPTEPPTTLAPTTVPPTARPVATPPPTVRPTTTVPPTTAVYYSNCAEARAAGAAPLRRGDPGYRSGLDRDGDGVACE